jgi:hypothetical protein
MRRTSDSNPMHLWAWLTSLAGTLLALLPVRLSAAQVPGVVELFTSQGCNTCPPAEALLGDLVRSQDVIALAYHVTYWDQLGWHDRFGLSAADARQQYYVAQLRLSTAFTPQAVINGRVSVIGSDRPAVLTALSKSTPSVPVSLRLEQHQARIELPAAAQPARSPLEVILVAYLPRAATEVGAGENAGHKLQEFDIVRAYRPLGLWHGSAMQFSVPLSSLPAEATGIAVLLQERGGPIAGATKLAVPSTMP